MIEIVVGSMLGLNTAILLVVLRLTIGTSVKMAHHLGGHHGS